MRMQCPPGRITDAALLLCCVHHLTALQVVMTALRAKQAELQAVLDKLAALDTDLAEKRERKESLEAEVELCKIKLDRCGSLELLPLAFHADWQHDSARLQWFSIYTQM